MLISVAKRAVFSNKDLVLEISNTNVFVLLEFSWRRLCWMRRKLASELCSSVGKLRKTSQRWSHFLHRTRTRGAMSVSLYYAVYIIILLEGGVVMDRLMMIEMV